MDRPKEIPLRAYRPERILYWPWLLERLRDRDCLDRPKEILLRTCRPERILYWPWLLERLRDGACLDWPEEIPLRTFCGRLFLLERAGRSMALAMNNPMIDAINSVFFILCLHYPYAWLLPTFLAGIVLFKGQIIAQIMEYPDFRHIPGTGVWSLIMTRSSAPPGLPGWLHHFISETGDRTPERPLIYVVFPLPGNADNKQCDDGFNGRNGDIMWITHHPSPDIDDSKDPHANIQPAVNFIVQKPG
jgi:hypothetical protein